VGAAGNTGARSASLNVLYSFPGVIGGPGPGAIAWNQVNQLVRSGHDVTLVVTGVARTVVGIRSIIRSLDLGGRRITERTIGRARMHAWHDLRTRRVLAAGEFDIVHTWPLAGARTLELARRLGVVGLRESPHTHPAQACTAVSREYALLGLQIPPAWSRFGGGDRIEAEEREYAAATAILVPSDVVAESFLSRGYESSQLIRHQYGFDPAEVRVPVRDAEHPFTAVFIGQCVPRKGLHYALRAWLASRASQTGRLLIYGSFDPDYRELLKSSLAHHSVTVCGPTEKPGAALAKADVLLLPSVEEGSALASYEAQGAGVIPLVSAASGAKVDHGVNGLLHQVGDVDTLAAQIDLIREQEKVRRFLRSAALAHAQTLTWTVAGRELDNAYRTALNEPVGLAYGTPSEHTYDGVPGYGFGAAERAYGRPAERAYGHATERTSARWDDSAVS
jgi:glycosyltransferase involved in cell wall biosynthesis